MEWKVEALVQGKLVQRLVMRPRVLDAVDAFLEDFLDCIEHAIKYSKKLTVVIPFAIFYCMWNLLERCIKWFRAKVDSL